MIINLLRRLKAATTHAFFTARIPPKVSETSRCRESLQPFCEGDGVDVGYGGDPISPSAICIDLPEKYAAYKQHVQHLHGDATQLHWFRDGVLDYVFSSHVLEDFVDTKSVLDEWLRVVRRGGRVVLFLPDEQTYRDHCRRNNKPPNPHHVHQDFGLPYIKHILSQRKDLRIVHERFPVSEYSFELVIEKIS